MTNDNEKKPEDIAEIYEKLRTRWAEHPELLAMLHRNARPLCRVDGNNLPKQTLGTTMLIGQRDVLCQIDFPFRLSDSCPVIIDYAEPIDLHAIQGISRDEAQASVMTMLKARESAAGNHFAFDSLGAITDIDRARLTGDPMFLPAIEGKKPVKKGIKFKPNATGMYRQFVGRNHKR